MLIGTLPPESVSFYFSHSTNTRLWDILNAIFLKQKVVSKGGNNLSENDKIKILDGLGLGITDIIYGYNRTEIDSTRDDHIRPKAYKKLLDLAVENNINELLFVYGSAYKWFLHSLEDLPPVQLSRLKGSYQIGFQKECVYRGKNIKCVLLPSPLNRGRKGETLSFKLDFYHKFILR